MAAIRLDGLCKNYGDVAVLRSIDLCIEEGEFVVLVGPSGCGKSTLLRLIAGLEQISSGEIRIGDRVVNEPGLRIPHPAMHHRRFVLEPLVEIAPEARHPELGKTARELLAALASGQTVRRL